MARRDRKAMADMRAMEEQAERMNPIAGTGATPSMGLSQFRGGRKMKGCGKLKIIHEGGAEEAPSEDMVGGGFLSDLHIPVVSNIAGLFGLGDGEMEGGALLGEMGHGTRKVGAGMHGGARDMGAKLSKHIMELHGKGWWDDFKSGFMSVIQPVASVAKAVLPLTGPMGRVASAGLSAVGLGKRRQTRRRRGGMRTGAYEGKGDEEEYVVVPGTGRAIKQAKRAHSAPSGEVLAMNPRFAEKEAANVLVKMKEGKMEGRGRSARAAIVKKVMADKGLSMIEASKYVKAHNLY